MLKLKTLKLQSAMISLEALAGPNALNQAIDRLPDFVADATQHFNVAVTTKPNEIMPVHYSRLAKILVKMPYMEMSHLLMFTPPGMRGTYMKHIEDFEAVEPMILNLRNKVIAPFAAWVNIMLASPTELSSQRNGLQIKNYDLGDLEASSKRLMASIDGGAHQAKVPYAQVVSRNADWPVIENKLEALNEHLLNTHRKDLIREVGDLNDSLNRLIDRIKHDPDQYAMSGKNLSLFAKTCYDIGRALEFYSVYTYQLRLLTVAIEDSQAVLDKYVVILK